MTTIVYATTNPAKFEEVSKLFAAQGIMIHSPKDLGVKLDVEETGQTLEANAILKAEAYRDAIKDKVIVLGDDTGVEIAALGDEPGIKVRRWKGYSMTDAEIISYCLDRLRDVPQGKRQAQFRTVIAVALRGQPTRVFSGTLAGEIVTDPVPQKHIGFPFESLFYVPRWGKVIGEIYQLPAADRADFQTHRHQAVLATLPYLATLTQQSRQLLHTLPN